MPDTRKTNRLLLDHDRDVAEQIEQLVEKLRSSEDIEERSGVKEQLARIIFGS